MKNFFKFAESTIKVENKVVILWAFANSAFRI